MGHLGTVEQPVGSYQRHRDDLNKGLGGHTEVEWSRCCCNRGALSPTKSQWVRGDGTMWEDPKVAAAQSTKNLVLNNAITVAVPQGSPIYHELLMAGFYSVFMVSGAQWGMQGMYAVMRRK